MPRARAVLPPARRREREKLLRDPVVRMLLRDLIVGPSNGRVYRRVAGAAQLIELGFALLEQAAASAEPPASRDLGLSRARRAARRGDRLRKGDAEIWTDLADGAAFEATFLLDASYTAELRVALRSLQARGLKAAGRSGLLWLLSELTPEQRADLAGLAGLPPNPLRPIRQDREALRRHARALRAIARVLDEE